MDAELSAVKDFLASHAPYGALEASAMSSLLATMSSVYARRGTEVIGLGASNDTAYVVRSGAVEIRDATDELVERAEEGTTFGVSSVRNRAPSAYRMVAIEDSLLLTVPGDVFRGLLARPEMGRFFDVQSSARLRAAVTATKVSESRQAIFGVTVRGLLGRAPVTAVPTTSIREVAQVMTTHNVSAVLITEAGRLVGIVTDRDLRRRVVAEGADVDAPVSNIMTRDPITIGPDSAAFTVLLEMTDRGVHHLPVTDASGAPLGLISAGDLLRLGQASPVQLAADIARQSTVDGVVTVASRLPHLVEQLVTSDVSADDIGRATSAVADAAIRRLVALAEVDLGPAPAPYCVVAMGSLGRLEAGLGADQDTAILIDDSGDASDAWYANLATVLRDGMERIGFPRCPGDVMATNPRWRQTVSQWRRVFRGWMNEPEPTPIMEAQIFFDMRPVAGEKSLYSSLAADILAIAPRSSRFLAHLAASAVQRNPPIGFFRNLVLERDGEHRNSLDLKHGGIAAVVQLARLYCLTHGLAPVNTQTRLTAARNAGALSAESADNLADAYEFICYQRVRHQGRQIREGITPDNYVDPDELSDLDKKHLRDAFAVVRTMQNALTTTYQLGGLV
jgi:CBS domain-containing protein